MKTFFKMMVLLMLPLAIWTGCSSDSETAKPVVLTGIQIDAANVKKTYLASEKLDLSGLVVTANYSNGTSKVLSKEEYTVTPAENSVFDESGEKTITITCNGKTDTFNVNVFDYLSDITITFPSEYQDKTDLLAYSEESKSFTAAEGYKSYVWWLDGEILTGIEGSNYTPENLEIGNHSLMLVVTDSTDEVYSATATFTIQK